MAKHRNNGDKFGDIDDTPVTDSGGFAHIPMPPQSVIDQEAESLPQVEPEELLTRPPQMKHSRETRSAGRSMKQIIDQFIADISGHPDCNLLGSAFGGRPAKAVEFSNTPVTNQHMVELRFVWRDAVQQQAIVDESAPSAFAPGGRYYDLIPKRGEREVVEETTPQGTPAWDNLVRKRETANV